MADRQDPEHDDIVPLAIEEHLRSQTAGSEDGSETRPLTSDTPLLGKHNLKRSESSAKTKSRFKRWQRCLCSSKAAILILVWNLIVSVSLVSLLDPSLYIVFSAGIQGSNDPDYGNDNCNIIMGSLGAVYSFIAILFLFYPLAGCLADTRCGRNKTVVNSICFIFWGLVSMTMICVLGFSSAIPLFMGNIVGTDFHLNIITQTVTSLVIGIVFGLPLLFGVILLLCSLVANVIQFGMDQLHDAPADDSVLYMHWYVWTVFLGSLVVRIPLVTMSYDYITICPAIAALALPFLGITLCIHKYKHNWFLIESGSRNPYKLVYKVLKFTKGHKNPIRRSAFTYCEDELPSRLDLGKEKYGGPFTTEEVENVKAFTGILSVLLTIGPMFMADVAVSGVLPSLIVSQYKYLIQIYNAYSVNLYASSFLTPLLIVVVIPFYLCLVRPVVLKYVPGMLKRMGLGMILLLVSGLCTLVMGLFGHDDYETSDNPWNTTSTRIIDYLMIGPHYLLIQNILNAVGYMLLYIASYEFICAQSPHEMKGLIIGTFFAIKGVFQLLGVLVVYAPIAAFCKVQSTFPVCGFTYYLINILIALIGIVAFTIVARRYQYRKRDEPDNTYRYAEEYYANAQDEPNYDYDDYDNLNCETIIR